MFWWFERKGQFLRYEARSGPDGFEFCIIEPGGVERVERFRDSKDLARRQAEFEESVKTEGWSGPHGWNL